ncbi:MAG: S8 family serine peptidase, partial [bacterium]
MRRGQFEKSFTIGGVFALGSRVGSVHCKAAVITFLALVFAGHPHFAMAQAPELSIGSPLVKEVLTSEVLVFSQDLSAAKAKAIQAHSRRGAAAQKVEARLDLLRERVEQTASEKIQAMGGVAPAQRAQLRLGGLSEAHQSKVKDDGRIQVYVILDSLSDTKLDQLRTQGFADELSDAKLAMAQGWIDYDRIDQLASFPFVKRVELPSYAYPQTGSVNSQGDAILNADDVRALPAPGPYTGTGIKVGVISDGATNRASAIASGDLPAAGVTMHPTLPGSGDEGTAMMEIIHDLAPGASLYFGGPNTDLEMSTIVNWMASTVNCHVICDDLGFFGAPYFEDGPVAQTVRAAVTTNGRVYCTSAGNYAQCHYQGLYDGAVPGFHDFKAGTGTDQGLNFRVAAGKTIEIFLQWNDQFGGSGNDYDLRIYDSTLSTMLHVSEDVQDGNDNPYEHCWYTNSSGSEIQVCAVVVLFSGVARTLEIFGWNTPGAADDDATVADSIIGHKALTEVISCATINASDPGNDDIAYYSSRGPSTISFPSAATRQTPFITGIDGVSVTGAGGFPNPFYGTSAASPHLAAICALMLSKDPNGTPALIRNVLAASASERGTTGFDNTFGNGLANALGINRVAPVVSSITRSGSNPTNASSVSYLVTFGESMTGVDNGDFTLFRTGGITGYSVSSVTGTGATRTVTVITGSNDGTLRLDVADNDSIINSVSYPLGGVGASNGNYTNGQAYTIDKTRPPISIGSPSLSLTRGGPVTYTVSYGGADNVTLIAANVTLIKTGTANGSVAVT